MDMLHLRPTQLQLEGLEDILFTVIFRNEFERRASASLKSSVISLLFRIEGTTDTELGNLNAVGVIGF